MDQEHEEKFSQLQKKLDVKNSGKTHEVDPAHGSETPGEPGHVVLPSGESGESEAVLVGTEGSQVKDNPANEGATVFHVIFLCDSLLGPSALLNLIKTFLQVCCVKLYAFNSN